MSTSSKLQAQELYDGWTQAEIALRLKIQPKIAKEKVTGSQLEILFTVHHYGQPVSIKKLSELTFKSSSAITQLVASLEKSGDLLRKHDTKDRRVVNVSLTQRGKNNFNKLQSIVVKAIDEIISDLSSDEVKEYIRINNKIAKNT